MEGREKVLDYRDSWHCTLVQCTYWFVVLFPFYLLYRDLTLIRAAGGLYDFETWNRYNSTMPQVTKNFKINVFLKNILLSPLSEKQCFQRLISQKVQEIARFLSIFVHSGLHGAYLTPLTPSTNTSCPGTPPANSRRTKRFSSRLHSL
jgi:hypothetical protein